MRADEDVAVEESNQDEQGEASGQAVVAAFEDEVAHGSKLDDGDVQHRIVERASEEKVALASLEHELEEKRVASEEKHEQLEQESNEMVQVAGSA